MIIFCCLQHYISFITYAFFGFMHNEFDGVNDWGCPCSAQPSGCAANCSLSGQEVCILHLTHKLRWSS